MREERREKREEKRREEVMRERETERRCWKRKKRVAEREPQDPDPRETLIIIAQGWEPCIDGTLFGPSICVSTYTGYSLLFYLYRDPVSSFCSALLCVGIYLLSRLCFDRTGPVR